MSSEEIKNLADSLDAKIMETHISWVLLTKKYAYKIKKPITTGFLDFSTLHQRKHFCEEELNLNREFTKDVYKGVVEINKNDSITINGDGEIIDYAVQMKALNNKKRLDTLLQKNKVSKKEIKRLAHTVASIHEMAKICHIDKMKSLSHEYEDLLKIMKTTKIASKKEIIKMTAAFEKATMFLFDYESIFEQRQNSGMIREVHGDLHSGNIFLYNPPILFDRIEFNKNFRSIDLLNEVAFLCADLECRAHKKLSKVFLNTYLKEINIPFGEEENKILIFYKSFAANIRAKVNLLLANQKNSNRKKYKKRYRKYFKAMNGYIKELISS